MGSQIQSIRVPQSVARSALLVLLCLSLVGWSIMPATAHVPAVFEQVQDDSPTIAEHGHLHDAKERVHQALHGHTHDVDNHDHSQVVPTIGERLVPLATYRDVWEPHAFPDRQFRLFRIERPPRV